MHTTISAVTLVLSLLGVFFSARMLSILPSEYVYALGNWLIRPSRWPLSAPIPMQDLATQLLMLKLALPLGVGVITYGLGRVLYRPRHDDAPHQSLLAGTFTGALSAALLLSWPVISQWAALAPPSYAPHRPLFIGIYLAHVLAIALLARAGSGLSSLMLYPQTSEAFEQSLIQRLGVLGTDLFLGVLLLITASLITSFGIGL